MYGLYGDIISAAERAIADFGETEELLEYPEVQADKAYYLSVLSKYNSLKFIKDKLVALTSALKEESELSSLLALARSEEEREELYGEISSRRRVASNICRDLSDAIGCKRVEERAYCRIGTDKISARFGEGLSASIKTYLSARGAKISDEDKVFAKEGYLKEISFNAVGEDVITLLSPLSGAHRVSAAGAGSGELRFAVTPSAVSAVIEEGDLKIDAFRSSGAGGQNINKVETAVRVTHIPTGITVVCQDERSQLSNKKRALETIRKRLEERCDNIEKKRIEADICAQYGEKHTPISFDASNSSMTDKRLKAFAKIAFPLTDEQFSEYLNGLAALC